MRVGHAIRECPAIEVQHGGTYRDPITQKPRQFDYRCSLRKEMASLSCHRADQNQPLRGESKPATLRWSHS
jgi:hypothetical protein